MKYLISLSIFIIILLNETKAKDTKKNGRTGKCNDFNYQLDLSFENVLIFLHF